MTSPLLDPVMIAIYPRWSEASCVVCEMMGRRHSDSYSIALAEDEQTAADFRQHWSEDNPQPLLLLRCSPTESVARGVEAVSEIGARKPGRALGVLVADGPKIPGFDEEHRADWNREFSQAVCKAIIDVQVFDYSPTWANSPPRVR